MHIEPVHFIDAGKPVVPLWGPVSDPRVKIYGFPGGQPDAILASMADMVNQYIFRRVVSDIVPDLIRQDNLWLPVFFDSEPKSRNGIIDQLVTIQNPVNFFPAGHPLAGVYTFRTGFIKPQEVGIGQATDPEPVAIDLVCPVEHPVVGPEYVRLLRPRLLHCVRNDGEMFAIMGKSVIGRNQKRHSEEQSDVAISYPGRAGNYPPFSPGQD